MPRLPRLVFTGFAALLITVSLGGCGGSSDQGSNGSTAGSSLKHPPKSAEVPPPRLPATDKKTYSTVEKASGDLRAIVTPVAYGTATRITGDILGSDVTALEAAKPRSSLLRRLRLLAITALRSAIQRGGGLYGKVRANAAIAEADRIDAGLRRYAASNPAANEIAPG